MSPGACRALVSSLFTTVVVATALGAAAVPAAAETEALDENALVTYTVRRDGEGIDVGIILNLANEGQTTGPKTWGPVFIEDGVEDALIDFSKGVKRAGEYRDLPGPWKSMNISIPELEPGARRNLTITYPLDAGALLDEVTPARLGSAYVYFCMTGQPADRGEVIARLPERYAAVTSGSPMTDEAIGLTTGNVEDPGDLFACVEGTVERNLTTDRRVMGPSDREVILQAPQDQEQWLGPARANAIPALEQIEAYLGHEIPGDRSVVVRMTPPATLGGYASDHSTPGIVQFDECAGVGGADPEGKCAAHAGGAYHEMAHAWFGADRFGERWMREGLAQWVASRVNPEVTCADISTVPADLDLSSWEVERPSAPDDVETIITEQQDASCAIMGVLADRIGEDQFKAVIASLLDAEEKYVGHAEPGRAVSDGVDWMEFLDAVDERGLVAAGDKDLDFAQNLLASYGVADDPTALEQRSALRARYHAFLDTATPLAAPAIVRREMDEWQFDDATVALDEADNVLDDLTSADDLLPEAGLVPFIQPDFEAAASLEDLALVRTQAATLLEAAKTILPPLNELRVVTPEEWTLPVGIRDAVTAQRFDDALAAVAPATSVAEDVTAANEALPEAGLLGRYKAEFEGATSADQLADLADRVAEVREEAESTGFELEGLRAAAHEAGDWAIPAAVMAPIAAAQIPEALDIVRDARIVVASARQAEMDLPEAGAAAEFRPRFEAVADAAEMAALRVEAEAQAQTAKTIGESLTELKTTVPDWTLPAILTSPIEQHDFKTAAATLSAAATWVRFADQADQRLPQIEAKARTRESFEGAVTLDEITAGADLAEDWATASGRVADAIAVTERERDMMTTFGMIGTDLAPLREQAIQAARDGDVTLATQRAQALVDAINDGSRNGGLRLAGIVFLIVAIIGVLGLWWLFRRNQGPPWARNSRPPWAEKPNKKALTAVTPPSSRRRGGPPGR